MSNMIQMFKTISAITQENWLISCWWELTLKNKYLTGEHLIVFILKQGNKNYRNQG